MATEADTCTGNGADEPLTPQQQTAVDLLATGANVTEAARGIGVSRQTVSGWLNHDAAFADALTYRRRDLRVAYLDRLRATADLAVDVLQELLRSTDQPPGVRLRAALGTLSTITAADRGACPACDRDRSTTAEEMKQRLAEILGVSLDQLPG